MEHTCFIMNTHKVTFAAAAAAMAVAMAFAVAPAFMTSASAKIQSVPTECTNPAGHQPGGQQPECQGAGLTQETENQNPAGHAPPGQNP
jgi:hypothetical protein